MLRFNVTNQILKREDDFAVVADSQNYLTAEFTFSEEWTEPITAVFKGGEKCISVFLEERQCTVPWEVIKPPYFSVSAFCGDRITANEAEVEVEASGYADGEAPGDPTPDVYTTLITLGQETKEIAQSVRSDADNGMFQGEKGDAFTYEDFTAEQLAGLKGDKGNIMYATFNVNVDSGQLEMTTPEDYGGVNFELNDKGELEVTING